MISATPKTIQAIIDEPILFAHMLGYDKLTPLHNRWIRKLMFSKEDYTLQAHRELQNIMRGGGHHVADDYPAR